jgi:two-component system chemotaxis sensor kinase CheA
MEINKELLDITLLSVDHLKILLKNGDNLDPEIQKMHSLFTSKIENIINRKLMGGDDYLIDKQTGYGDISGGLFNSKEANRTTFHIRFQPNEYIFNNGTNPLFLIDEINTLGTSAAVAHLENVPAADTFDCTKCYTWWEIFVATHEKSSVLDDVFIFVEDDSIIKITEIAPTDLFLNHDFKKYIESLQKSGNQFNIEILKKLPGIGGKIKPVVSVETPEHIVFTEPQPAVKAAQPIVTAAQPAVGKGKPEAIISSIRVSSGKVDLLMNLVSEMVTLQARLNLYTESHNDPELMSIAESVQKLSRQLRDNAFSISLIPIGSILTRFQRLVRDLSGELGKKVNFIIKGEETELDKTIIENLSDPLMHILRNSLDHGIETPEVRLRNGKAQEGNIFLKAFYSGSNVHIEVKDDGAGIDPEKILHKARQKGLISEQAILDKSQIIDLVFTPGFSTAEAVSDVSGRGVGMDVVNRKISEIRGEVLLDSEKGAGTTVTIILPLTLSIIDGMQVNIGGSAYIIPLYAVHKIYSVSHSVFQNSFDNLIALEGEQLPFFSLREQFRVDGEPPEREEIVVVKYENRKVGLVIDKVLGEYQTVLKPLGKHYKSQEFISGGTILGDGTVALVLDTNKIISKFSTKTQIMEDSR